jgi:hypothetical protein
MQIKDLRDLAKLGITLSRVPALIGAGVEFSGRAVAGFADDRG